MNQPARPTQISEYARACLDRLAASGLGQYLSLGGAFGLAHYYEYRSTRDVDAWWVEPVSGEERQRITHLLEETLRSYGQVRTRAWGDVVSVELMQEGRTVFSFQIAHRSGELQPPLPGPWPGGIRVDSLDDLVASKMTALVERGAPRDFRDIYMLCQSAHSDIAHCWQLWEERQRLAGELADHQRATLAIRTHLARLEQARPLGQIADAEERAMAGKLRTWFAEEFLHDFSD
jgi:hypothetical protein